jgi:hypothetical protein
MAREDGAPPAALERIDAEMLAYTKEAEQERKDTARQICELRKRIKRMGGAERTLWQ